MAILEKLSSIDKCYNPAETNSKDRYAWIAEHLEHAIYQTYIQSVGLSNIFIEYPKSLLALAAALELVIEKGAYDKIIVTRSTPEIAESIGFLSGTEEEKMAPWLAAITDSLEVLHKQDESMSGSMNYIIEKANIQFKSLCAVVVFKTPLCC